MMNTRAAFLALSADDILAIDPTNPEAIFQPDFHAITSDFLVLSMMWYPDINKHPKAGDVQRRNIELRDAAKEKLARNEWQRTGTFSSALANGNTLRASVMDQVCDE